MLHYDSINNIGTGHSNSASVWKDLAGAISNNYSIVATIKPVKTGLHPRIVVENPFPTIYIHSNQDYKFSFYGQDKDTQFAPASIPSETEIINIIVMYDSAKLTLYVNGEKTGTISTSTPPTATEFACLGSRIAGDRKYSGLIYDRVITDFEAKKSYITNSSKYN